MSLPTFVSEAPFAIGETVTLGEDAAHHLRVRRLDTGMRVGLLDGSGSRGAGVLTLLAKRHATVHVDAVELVAPPSPVHLLLPVADKDRMLWLAEKATELELTTWRPVLFRRSRHVTPRGEGPTFHQRVRGRIAAALEQSGGAWAPTMYPEAALGAALAAAPEGVRLLLDGDGVPLRDRLAAVSASARAVVGDRTLTDGPAAPAVTIALGPEGGIEPAEREELVAAGFVPVSLGRSILRFETAGLAALAAVRVALGDARGDTLGDAPPPIAP
ncbi:MAG: 16S rRNA (uracil(1498)-N(3))-methyltransferase [Gemmatimonadetes bacterium]|nr:16S rRNA (uracil(1498)-N(3))-methyltransferase [Gemmatimonadota bacterium]